MSKEVKMWLWGVFTGACLVLNVLMIVLAINGGRG